MRTGSRSRTCTSAEATPSSEHFLVAHLLCARCPETAVALLPLPLFAAGDQRLVPRLDLRFDKLRTGLLSVPRLKHRRRVAANDDDPFPVAAQVTGGVDQRFTEKQRRARWCHDLVNQRRVLVGAGNDLLPCSLDLVATGNTDRASIIRPQFSQIRQRLDEGAMVETVFGISAYVRSGPVWNPYLPSHPVPDSASGLRELITASDSSSRTEPPTSSSTSPTRRGWVR